MFFDENILLESYVDRFHPGGETKKAGGKLLRLFIRTVVDYWISFAYFANSRSFTALAAKVASCCFTLAMLLFTRSALLVLAPTIAIR